MKIAWSVTALLIVAVVQADLTDEQKAKLKQHQEECQKTFPVDQQLLEKARKGEIADNKPLKDYLFCIFEKAEFVTSEGKIQPNVIETKLSSLINKESAKKLVETCTSSQQQSDKYEVAESVYKCIFNETKFSLI